MAAQTVISSQEILIECLCSRLNWSAVLLNAVVESVFGLWRTDAGGNGTVSTPGDGEGNYAPDFPATNVFDGDLSTGYASYGTDTRLNRTPNLNCFSCSGLYWSIQSSPALLTAFRLSVRADFLDFRPTMITIEGSNTNASDLLLGSSWTLIYNGSAGLDHITYAQLVGDMQRVSNNWAWYRSYRLLVTSTQHEDPAVLYSEVEFYGYY